MERAHLRVPDDSARAVHELSGDLIRRTLAEMFGSAPFRASKQSQQLLRYVVEHSLTGHGELLKERLIGVNVFGRQPDYDTNEDPIVRARAAEVRKRLAQFYLGEGSRSSIRIEIAPGSYHATFTEIPEKTGVDAKESAIAQSRPGPIAPVLKPPPVEFSKTPSPTGLNRRAVVVSLMSLALFCLGACVWFVAKPDTPIDRFWRPFFDSPGPVVLYSGANAVYMLSPSFINRYKATHRLDDLENQGREFAVPISSDMKLGADDLLPFTNDFTTIGDLFASVRVGSLLAIHRKRVDLRCGEDVAFSDIRQSPTILIGAFNNSWTMELTGDLPITFQNAGNMTISDQTNRKQVWTPTFTPDERVSIDYAVVTRMPHSKTGQALVTIAGMTQAGTHAAADFITDPEQMKKLRAVIPPDWDQKNLQFVLQTKVVNNIPTAPVLVATKSW